MTPPQADSQSARRHATVLVIAAHPDDEVLGCGGLMARMTAMGAAVHVLLMADGETSRPRMGWPAGDAARVMARQAAAKKACAVLGCASVEVMSLPDNRLDSLQLLDIIQLIEPVVCRHQPSMVLTHHAGDVNVDHRLVHEAVITACRPQPAHPVKELLFFEIPSSTEWRPGGVTTAFLPNWFFDISSTIDRKLEALKAYESELRPFPHPRSTEAIVALARWRGATVGVAAAEAFVLGRGTY